MLHQCTHVHSRLKESLLPKAVIQVMFMKEKDKKTKNTLCALRMLSQQQKSIRSNF